MCDVTIKDFYPFNTWIEDVEGPTWEDYQAPQYLIDQTTGRSYLNEEESVVRTKCTLLTLGSPFVHLIASFANVAYRIWNLVSFTHFRDHKTEYDWQEKQPYSFEASLKQAGIDLLRIFTTPIAYVGLELAAIYGTLLPYNGRKLYATIERAQYGNCILAPCFQPDATRHLFGGDINKKTVPTFPTFSTKSDRSHSHQKFMFDWTVLCIFNYLKPK